MSSCSGRNATAKEIAKKAKMKAGNGNGESRRKYRGVLGLFAAIHQLLTTDAAPPSVPMRCRLCRLCHVFPHSEEPFLRRRERSVPFWCHVVPFCF